MNMKKYKIIGLVLIAFLVFGIFAIPVKASMSELSLISTNPGEDSSSQMRLSWQSSESTCTLYYTVSSDVNFTNCITKQVSGIKNTVKYVGNDSYFKYDVELNDLQGNTKYIYKIKANAKTSIVYSFKTAGNKGNFNFALIGDIHANSGDSAIKHAAELIKVGENFVKDDGGFDFVLCQGDVVKYGQRYEDWEQWNDHYITSNYMFSICPGNKEYYNTGHSITSYEWFEASYNNPKNGIEELPTVYWFLYDSVLFFQLDNINPDAKSYTDKLQTWMANVINQNEGKYQYIVVVHHYADFYSAPNSNNICDWGSYNEKWYKFYDAHSVDYVISGDYHSYCRTNQLYNNEVSTDPSKGTVYVTVPMVAPTAYSTSITNTTNKLIAKWTPDGSATHGASYFKVSNGGMTYYEFGQDGKVYDSVTVKPKHLSEISLNAMLETVKVIPNADKTINQIYFSKDYIDIVTSINIRINDSSKATFFPANENVNYYNLTSLKKGDKLSLRVKFASGTTKSIDLDYNLADDYGTIYGFHAEINDNKLEFKWEAELINNVVSKYELYDGTNLIASLTSDKNSYSTSDLSLIKKNITFKAITNDNEVVYQNNYQYFTLADYNYDTLVDKKDLDALVNEVLNGTLPINHDVDGDKNFDIYDLTCINLAINGNKDLKTTYKVTFIDLEGNVISTQFVNKGENAKEVSFDEVDGYTLCGYSKSLNKIYQDTVIYAKYILK